MCNKLIKFLHDTREFFWPLLEGEAKQYEQLSTEQILSKMKEESEKEKIDELIEMSKDIFEREENRRSTIESKATTLLGATGLTITLIVNFGKPLFLEPTNTAQLDKFTIYILSIFFIVSIVYFSNSIRFAFKALGRRGYYALYPKDVIEMKDQSSADYRKKIAAIILEKTIKNYSIVNEKVDWMVMSQEYFKRGIFSIIIVALMLSVRVFLNYLSKYLVLM